MEPQATPEFYISPMRVLTLPETPFFYIAGKPVPFSELDKDFDAMLDNLETAKAQAHLDRPGPDIVRYFKVEGSEPSLFLMEVGILVKSGAQPAGAAQVKTLPPFHCAGLLLWGGLAHIRSAYEALQKAIQEAGLVTTGENEEWTYLFVTPDSPHNLMALYIGVNE